jgi:hypothetical protein
LASGIKLRDPTIGQKVCAAFRLDSGVLTVDGMESCDVALEMGPLKSIWTTTIMSVHQIFSRKTI